MPFNRKTRAISDLISRQPKTSHHAIPKQMQLTHKIKQSGAAGYILLWLLGIPLPILFVIFLLRGCS